MAGGSRMKKWIASVLVLISHLFGADFTGTLDGIVGVETRKGYLILSDGSIWEVFGFVSKYQIMLPWTHGVDLHIPDGFDLLPSQWVVGPTVNVFAKADYSPVDVTNASNKDELDDCTHVLVNTGTNKILFGLHADPAIAFPDIYSKAVSDRYLAAYFAGFRVGYQKGLERGRKP